DCEFLDGPDSSPSKNPPNSGTGWNPDHPKTRNLARVGYNGGVRVSRARIGMKSSFTSKIRRPYLMAVVLGTAIAASGTESKARADEISPRAITNISRYCTACWRNARLPQDQWNDCTQEVLTRL